MSGWPLTLAALRHALDTAADTGTPRALWWRDDDAVATGPRLDALVGLAQRHGAPVTLAVIPAAAQPSLLSFCEAHGLAVAQHGVAHINHEPEGRPAELGPAREATTIVADCVAARDRLSASSAFVPIMVAPWNRMRCDLAPPLAAAGYAGVSLFGSGVVEGPPRRVDTHIDPIDWRAGKVLHPDGALAAMVTRAFAQAGPVGLLTHHAVHTEAVSAFVEAVVELASRHDGARWLDAHETFALPRAPS